MSWDKTDRKTSKSVTIVVPTHNRYQKLRNLLSSVREVWNDAFAGVIVVDDSQSKQSLNDFEDINVQHMKFDTRIFVSRAKNFGWRASDTDFIFFIDDDNVLGEGTLQPLLETISASESMGAVMPGVLYRSAPEVVWVYATPFRDKRLGLNLVGRNSPRNPSIENRILRTDALPNASIVRRRALVQVGGFDENLVVNSSMDMCQRLKLGGWKVVANPASLIYHDVEVPGQPGYWAAHGASDPELVRYNLRDWYLIMKRLHPEERSFRVRFTLSSISFVLPNLFAYLMRGKSRMRLIESIVKGYIEGLQLASSGTHGYTD